MHHGGLQSMDDERKERRYIERSNGIKERIAFFFFNSSQSLADKIVTLNEIFDDIDAIVHDAYHE